MTLEHLLQLVVMVLSISGWMLYFNWDLVRPHVNPRKILATTVVSLIVLWMVLAIYLAITKNDLIIWVFAVPFITGCTAGLLFFLFTALSHIWHSIAGTYENDSAQDGTGWSNT